MEIQFKLDFQAWEAGIKQLASKFTIAHYLILYFGIHLLQITSPESSFVFDEAHYVPASIATLNGIAANAEHPPLTKIIGAIGIWLFGNNWFGWRLPQVIIQIAALYVFYLLIKRFLGNPWALGGTILLSLDTIWFIHGGALLIDMSMFLFGFLALELYFRKRYWLSAGSMALAFLSREMSIFLFATLVIYHIYANRKQLKPALKTLSIYTLIAMVVFGGLLWAYDAKYQPAKSTSVTNYVGANVVMNNGTAVTTQYITTQSTSKDLITDPISHLAFIMSYHGFTGMVIYQGYYPYDYAWNWILPFDPVAYRVNSTMTVPVFRNIPVNNSTIKYFGFQALTSPTYFRVDVSVTAGDTTKTYQPIWYRSQENLFVWYGFWPALAGCLYVLLKRQKYYLGDRYGLEETKAYHHEASQKRYSVLVLAGLLLNFLPWLIMSVSVSRIGFSYYGLYFLPYSVMGLVFFIKQLPAKWRMIILSWNILGAAAFFLIYFPIRPYP